MARTFRPGERVTATIYGEPKVGTVVRNPVGGRSTLVWVRWDGRDTSSWYHADSLTTAGLDEKGTSHG